MRVYTITLPRFLSGFVRRCINLFKSGDQSSQASAKPRKRRRKDKMPG